LKSPELKDYFRSPKGRFFCLLLTLLLAWGIFIVLPFNKGDNSIFAKPYSNFINIEPGTQAAPSLIIGGTSVVSAVPSPIFISSQNLGTLLSDMADNKDGNSIIKYTVEKGETLSQIADKFNISVETILLANELSNSRIVPGQELMILPTNGIIHMVEKGDSVKSLAAYYKTQQEDIINFNDLSQDGSIYVGDILIIPGGKMPIKQASKPAIKDVADSDSSGSSTQLTLPGSYFMIPTNGKLSQGAHFSYTSNGHSYYNSVDIANDIGTPIMAAAGGQIQIVKNAWPYGKYITISHPNGVITLYAHMSSFAKGIVSGMAVTQGQIIGYMGNTGKVVTLGGTGSHLHFETRGTTNPLTKYKTGSMVK